MTSTYHCCARATRPPALGPECHRCGAELLAQGSAAPKLVNGKAAGKGGNLLAQKGAVLEGLWRSELVNLCISAWARPISCWY
jgi:hypothetical protein